MVRRPRPAHAKRLFPKNMREKRDKRDKGGNSPGGMRFPTQAKTRLEWATNVFRLPGVERMAAHN
jgi:hypothetical protein